VNAPFRSPPQLERARLTARDFWLLADSGAFEKYAKSELIEGEIWVVNSVWVWHARTMAHLIIELGAAVRGTRSDLIVYGSGSVDLTDDSVPEPDVSVGIDHDGKGLPLEKLALAVEVSDSTLHQDLHVKARVYGSAGVPEYWVIDREGARVVQMWSPVPGGYAERREVPFGETLVSTNLAGIRIDTSGIRR
jgi:Uma2 family endonuclease